MPEEETCEAAPHIRSEDEINGRLPCVRCDHEECCHEEDLDEEDGAIYCHVRGCNCDGFVSPYGIA